MIPVIKISKVYRIAFCIFSLFLFGALTVSAITLTKDVLRLVVVPMAVSGTMCQSDAEFKECIGDAEPIVFGRSDVYRHQDITPAANMVLIVFRSSIYRDATASFSYYQINCKKLPAKPDELEPWIPKGTEILIEKCEQGGLKEQSGTGTLVKETGHEELNAFNYKLLYNLDGTYSSLELAIGSENFKLQSIEKVIKDIRWEPK